jgi:hypothetical protein
MVAPKNLLQLPALQELDTSEQFYLVKDQKDYRLSLAVLLTLFTKQRIGLENVDNTSDAQKPVSDAVRMELDGKANKLEVVPYTVFNQLVEQLQNYISAPQLNSILGEINNALNTKEDKQVVTDKITTALAPISASLALINNEITLLKQAQLTGYVTTDQLVEAIETFRVQMEQSVASQVSLLLEPTTSSLAQLIQQVTSQYEAQAGQIGALTLGLEAQQVSLVVLEQKVTALESRDQLVLGPNDW